MKLSNEHVNKISVVYDDFSQWLKSDDYSKWKIVIEERVEQYGN